MNCWELIRIYMNKIFFILCHFFLKSRGTKLLSGPLVSGFGNGAPRELVLAHAHFVSEDAEVWSQAAHPNASNHERQSQDLMPPARIVPQFQSLSSSRGGQGLRILSLLQMGKSRTESSGDSARALCVAVVPRSHISPGPSWDTQVGC